MSKAGLLESIVCTAVFALVFSLVVSCGGSGNIMQTLTATTNATVRLVNHIKPVMVTIPPKVSSTQPFMAAFLQSGSQGSSQLQQSFEGQGPCLGVAMPSSGYIPIWYYMENGIGGPFGTGSLACSGVFSQIGGGVDQISGKTLSNPGVPMFLSGTLSTLVATGVTVNGNITRCSDLTTTVPVNDGQLVQPYFVIANNSIVVGIGTTQLAFTCNLNVSPGDQVYNLVVQFAKI